MAIKVSGRREVLVIKEPNPSEPSAAPKILPRSLTAAPRWVLPKSIVERSTMPNTIARIVVVRIERIIPPLMPLMTKKTVMAKPAKARRTVGLLKLTSPGTAAEFAVIATFALSAPSPATV